MAYQFKKSKGKQQSPIFNIDKRFFNALNELAEYKQLSRAEIVERAAKLYFKKGKNEIFKNTKRKDT